MFKVLSNAEDAGCRGPRVAEETTWGVAQWEFTAT